MSNKFLNKKMILPCEGRVKESLSLRTKYSGGAKQIYLERNEMVSSFISPMSGFHRLGTLQAGVTCHQKMLACMNGTIYFLSTGLISSDHCAKNMASAVRCQEAGLDRHVMQALM